jgi:hypothetical protein
VSVSAADFLISYPEFTPLHTEDAPLVDAVLARAARRLKGPWPSDVLVDMIMLSAADMLARGPWGRDAKLSAPGSTTSYAEELTIRKKAFACGRSRVL